MAKDRFKTRASYDSTFKYGQYEYNKPSKREVTSEQVAVMKEIYLSDRINNWEKGFIKDCLTYRSLSPKQKSIINGIYKRYVNLS